MRAIIYCIGYEERKQIVADWYTSEEARALFIGASGTKEVLFTFTVSAQANDEQISAMADDLAWFKCTFPATGVSTEESVEA